MPRVRHRQIAASIIISIFFTGFLVATPAIAQTKRCTCDFADSKWEAYGTKSVCATFMHKARTSCEVEFGGFGADPKVMSTLGIDPAAYQAERVKALTTYFQSLQGRPQELFDPKFLQTILPIIMRGAYLRPMNDVSPDGLKDLDSTVIGFFADEKNATIIREVFLGGSSYSTSYKAAKIEVKRGYVIVDHPVGRIVVIYVPQD
jgi:hypothetical protein